MTMKEIICLFYFIFSKFEFNIGGYVTTCIRPSLSHEYVFYDVIFVACREYFEVESTLKP